MKILLVEDDETTTSTLVEALTAYNYTVNTAVDGQTGLELAQTFHYDLLVLDINIPKIDGINLCRQVRSQGLQMPILLLTAKDTNADRVMGLEAGADDYVVKPYHLSELIARIRALLRRGSLTLPKVLTWEKLHLDPDAGEVTYDGKLLHLTPKEYGLLELFMRNPRRIFSRSVILDRIWSNDEFPGEEAVTTQIKGLRQKLKTAGMSVDLIETVYGLGYRLKGSLFQEQEESMSSRPESHPLNLSQADTKVRAAVAQIWTKFKESLPEKLIIFEQAGTSLASGILDNQLRQNAQREAHRLIGSLGSFGFLEGSEIAREIDQLLQSQTTVGQQDATRLQELIQLLQQALEKEPFAENNANDPNQKIPPLPPSPHSPLPTPHSPISSARLLIIDDDAVLTEQIEREAIAWGLQVEVTNNLTAARVAIASHPPDVILLDLSFPDTEENGLTLLSQLSDQKSKIPVLVFTGQNQLSSRVEVARLGAYSFLQKPISPTDILKAVTVALNEPKEAKVMVVDDDPKLLEFLSTLLQPWGLQVTTLANPQCFWEVLEAANPDLLILDVEMPGYSGIELCQVVRNDLRWSQLPILFLSVHTEAQTVQEVFSVGADDYIRKPIVEPELIARVLNRLERSPLRRELAATRKLEAENTLPP